MDRKITDRLKKVESTEKNDIIKTKSMINLLPEHENI